MATTPTNTLIHMQLIVHLVTYYLLIWVCCGNIFEFRRQ